MLEVLLVVVKTGLVFAIDVGGLCALLALTATYLRDAERAKVGDVEETALDSRPRRRGKRARAMAGG